MPAHTSEKGFTLIELLVVISIIAILSIIGMTVFSSVQKSARDARRRGDIDAISKALEIYKSTNGSYPQGGGIGPGWCTYISNPSFPQVKNAISNYFAGGQVPSDPTRAGVSGDYLYWTGDFSNFTLLASLEGQPAVDYSASYGGCAGWTNVYNLKMTNQQ